jgi:hypothetical protein
VQRIAGTVADLVGISNLFVVYKHPQDLISRRFSMFDLVMEAVLDVISTEIIVSAFKKTSKLDIKCVEIVSWIAKASQERPILSLLQLSGWGSGTIDSRECVSRGLTSERHLLSIRCI